MIWLPSLAAAGWKSPPAYHSPKSKCWSTEPHPSSKCKPRCEKILLANLVELHEPIQPLIWTSWITGFTKQSLTKVRSWNKRFVREEGCPHEFSYEYSQHAPLVIRTASLGLYILIILLHFSFCKTFLLWITCSSALQNLLRSSPSLDNVSCKKW